MPVTKPIPFRLVSIETNQFAVLQDAYTEDADFQLDINAPLTAVGEHHGFILDLSIRYLCNSKPFVVLEIACFFEIEAKAFNTLFIDKKKKEELKIPVEFHRHLAMIAVGTARGILFEKLKDTDFRQFILPTINLTEIIKDDLILSKDE